MLGQTLKEPNPNNSAKSKKHMPREFDSHLHDLQAKRLARNLTGPNDMPMGPPGNTASSQAGQVGGQLLRWSQAELHGTACPDSEMRSVCHTLKMTS